VHFSGSYYQNSISFQLHGGYAPLTPDQGLYPWTSLGAPPPDPHHSEKIAATGVKFSDFESRNVNKASSVKAKANIKTSSIKVKAIHITDADVFHIIVKQTYQANYTGLTSSIGPRTTCKGLYF